MDERENNNIYVFPKGIRWLASSFWEEDFLGASTLMLLEQPARLCLAISPSWLNANDTHTHQCNERKCVYISTPTSSSGTVVVCNFRTLGEIIDILSTYIRSYIFGSGIFHFAVSALFISN